MTWCSTWCSIAPAVVNTGGRIVVGARAVRATLVFAAAVVKSRAMVVVDCCSLCAPEYVVQAQRRESSKRLVVDRTGVHAAAVLAAAIIDCREGTVIGRLFIMEVSQTVSQSYTTHSREYSAHQVAHGYSQSVLHYA